MGRELPHCVPFHGRIAALRLPSRISNSARPRPSAIRRRRGGHARSGLAPHSRLSRAGPRPLFGESVGAAIRGGQLCRRRHVAAIAARSAAPARMPLGRLAAKRYTTCMRTRGTWKRRIASHSRKHSRSPTTTWFLSSMTSMPTRSRSGSQSHRPFTGMRCKSLIDQQRAQDSIGSRGCGKPALEAYFTFDAYRAFGPSVGPL